MSVPVPPSLKCIIRVSTLAREIRESIECTDLRNSELDPQIYWKAGIIVCSSGSLLSLKGIILTPTLARETSRNIECTRGLRNTVNRTLAYTERRVSKYVFQCFKVLKKKCIISHSGKGDKNKSRV